MPDFPAGNVVNATDGQIVGTFPTAFAAIWAMFVFHRSVFGVSLQNTTILGCWSARTGALAWQFADGTGVGLTTPTVVNRTVYVANSSGVLYALNPKNGKKLRSDSVGNFGGIPMLSAGQGTLVMTDDARAFAYRQQ